MIRDIDILSKGIYRHAQIKNFLNVKQYIFSRKGNKKYLALRFENGADVVFDSMSFTVTTLDSNGSVLEKIPVVCKKIKIRPGEIFAYDKLIRVKSDCTDFTVTFNEVYSGLVVYTEYAGHPVARYAKKNSSLEGDAPFVSRMAPKPPKKHNIIMKLIALLALIIIVATNAIYIVTAISNENERRREEYYERMSEQAEQKNQQEKQTEKARSTNVG
ncbi:MAG: hypothetical protein J6L85_03035 [Clostridia bacterium]|nr:hypothetical protein [Clostridia bacterium]